jgi:transposase
LVRPLRGGTIVVDGCGDLKEEESSRGERPGGLSGDEREELQRLRDENAKLRMEREILRKAAVFYAREDDGR